MNAFLTGSQVYGKPTAKSDIDLVIYTDEETAAILLEQSEFGKCPCKFGKLNLIITTTKPEYNAWKDAKDKCVGLAPLDRDTAIEIHRNFRKQYGVAYLENSGRLE